MASERLPVAAVLLGSACDASSLQSAVDDCRGAGASLVVVVLADGTPAPRDARVARVKHNASWITGVRMGMALLANSPSRLALLWAPSPRSDDDAASLSALIVAARAADAPVTAPDRGALVDGPAIIARDAWLELLTLGEQGLDAVAARRGAHFIR